LCKISSGCVLKLCKERSLCRFFMIPWGQSVWSIWNKTSSTTSRFCGLIKARHLCVLRPVISLSTCSRSKDCFLSTSITTLHPRRMRSLSVGRFLRCVVSYFDFTDRTMFWLNQYDPTKKRTGYRGFPVLTTEPRRFIGAASAKLIWFGMKSDRFALLSPVFNKA